MLQLNQNYKFTIMNFIILIFFFINLSAQDKINDLLQSFKNGYKPVGQKAYLITQEKEKKVTCYNNQNAHALILYNIVKQFTHDILREEPLKRPLDSRGAENPHYFDDVISCLDIYDTFSNQNNPDLYDEKSMKSVSQNLKSTYVQKLCNGNYNRHVPLHYIVERHKTFDYAQFLIDHGADVNKLDLTGQYTALDIVRRSEYENEIKRRIMFEGLLKNGARPARMRTIDYLISAGYIQKINSDHLKLGKLELRQISKITSDEFTAKKSRYK
ncbi:MAG: hypothetical protein ACXWL2_02160 [Candidatus Chromulinivorax sp.]